MFSLSFFSLPFFSLFFFFGDRPTKFNEFVNFNKFFFFFFFLSGTQNLIFLGLNFVTIFLDISDVKKHFLGPSWGEGGVVNPLRPSFPFFLLYFLFFFFLFLSLFYCSFFFFVFFSKKEKKKKNIELIKLTKHFKFCPGPPRQD